MSSFRTEWDEKSSSIYKALGKSLDIKSFYNSGRRISTSSLFTIVSILTLCKFFPDSSFFVMGLLMLPLVILTLFLILFCGRKAKAADLEATKSYNKLVILARTR